MKKKFLFMSAATVLSASIMFSSCIGSFTLSNKLLSWNKSIDGKIINEILFLVFSPAYAVTLVADLLVLNSIEFWTGSNPIQAGIIKTVEGENGIYTVETLENGYNIKNEQGEEVELIYNKEENSWSMVHNNETTKLFKYTDDNNAIVYMQNGAELQVELSATGLMAVRQAVSGSLNYAMK